MSNNLERFSNAIEGKRVPTLTLDNKWYRLFKQAERTGEIEELEKELNKLVKEQGRINDERHKLRALKSKLMDEIVSIMDENDKKSAKKKEENSKLIDEINDKIKANEDLMLDLPRDIDKINKKLMIATMEECYKVLSENTKDISSIGEWINNMRVELKKNVIKKQEMELRNVEIYSYMHDIFGPDVIDLFDITYDIEGKKQEILEKQRAIREQKNKVGNDGKNTDTTANGQS